MTDDENSSCESQRHAFRAAVITPRWLYVLAAATPSELGDPLLWDETLDPLDLVNVQSGDVVGIGIHTGNALRGYALGRLAKQRGAIVIFGGIHARLYPEEALTLGQSDFRFPVIRQTLVVRFPGKI